MNGIDLEGLVDEARASAAAAAELDELELEADEERTSVVARSPTPASSRPRASTDRALVLDVLKMLRGPCGLTRPERFVLVAMADFGATCWASLPTIGTVTGYDERTVRRAIALLVERGLVHGVAQPGRVTRYTIDATTIAAAADAYLASCARARSSDTVSGVEEYFTPLRARARSSDTVSGVPRSECPPTPVTVSGVPRSECPTKVSSESPTKEWASDGRQSGRSRAPAGAGR